jgi:ribosomal protein S18 acetylase RimI-like enzyme
MEYKLIDVKREDLLAIQILGENNLNTSLVYKKNLLRDLLFSNDHILLKLVKNKEIIGIIICSLIPSENRIHIKYFLIDKKYRKKGLGTYMLKSITRMNYNTISLHVDTKNLIALKMYKKNNFRIIKLKEKYYSNPIRDSYYMILRKNITTEHFIIKKNRNNLILFLILLILFLNINKF